MLFQKIFKALNQARIKYVVVGGVAVVLYGYERFTKDLDLIVFMEEKNLGRFYDVLMKLGYLAKVPVQKEQFMDAKQREQWKKEKGMLVFSFVERNPPFQIIDMFVDEPIAFADVYLHRRKIKIEGTTVPLIGIDHLIKLKRKAARAQDLLDIENLKAIKRMKRI